jgi:hypothetical protein
MSSTTNLSFPNPAVDRLIDLTVPGIEFSDKPILVGGLAMGSTACGSTVTI